MSKKKFDSSETLHNRILKGVDVLADNVASTLGPRGRNVIIHQKGKNPIITKDGVTVAKFIDLEDPIENLGAQIIKQASSQTSSDAGDGTTTATVLSRAILRNAQKYLLAGVSPIEIKRGIDATVEVICDNLSNMSRPIMSEEDIRQIATISANGDEQIGKLVATAVDKVGKDGSITIEEARSLQTTLDTIDGFRFDSGYVAQAFVTDERRNLIKYEDLMILVTDKSIETVEDMLPTLEIAAREQRPLLVVAENVEDQALAALIMNSIRGTMKVAAVKAPRYGEERRNILKDLCLSTGATFISRESGIDLREIKLKHLGRARSVEIMKNITTIAGGDTDYEEMEKRIEQLKAELEQTEDLYECERVQDRIARLMSSVAIIKVGAPTEIEVVEKKHRIEDALEAVRAAQLEGIVPGGGVALIRAAKRIKVKTKNEQQKIGVSIIKDSVKEPLKQMAINAGESPDLILSKVEKSSGDKGWDFASAKLVNMYDCGIIDPVKVTTSALRNAASVASTLLTTNYAIVEY